jgi:hypothetical protein
MRPTFSDTHYVLRLLSSEQRVRAIIVLMAALAIGVTFLNCPGPLFQKAKKVARLEYGWNDAQRPPSYEQIRVLQRVKATSDLQK